MYILMLLKEPARSILAAPPAYLDPGSGSYLLQLLLAGILGGIFVVRMYWTRIKGFFRRIFRRGQSPDEHAQ
jgi:hypothetical protein